MMNKPKGNMYAFVTHTWNTIKGRCPHDCSYCYMKRWGKQEELHFDEKELKTDLGSGNFIFVGSSCDMWSWIIDYQWIYDTLLHCVKFNKNKYLFQSKNPARIKEFYGMFLFESVFGTTIETDKEEYIGRDAPSILDRYIAIEDLSKNSGCSVMITIEPIMDFNLISMVEMIRDIEPLWVNVGADSGGHKLPEPPAGKIWELIAELSKFTEVRPKKNLNRILKEAKP